MSIAYIFVDAQKSSINHKSLTKRLRRLEVKNENSKDQFDEQIKECIIRCLEVSKSERAGLNIVKFICSYCAATQVEQEEQDDEEDADEENNNMTNQIMILLLPYMSAKDKIVRYRATQIISQLMGIVQEIDDDLYQAIRHELGKRVRDKVPQIRLEAVCALGRLLENEMQDEAQAAQEKSQNDDDEDMMDDEEEEVESADLLGKLLDVLQNDTNADVRRALLLNMPIDAKTTTYLLERARDKDASVRRALFIKLMPKMGDFRHLSLTLREKILRWGLRDKDERVRKGTVKMFSTLWIEQIAKFLYQNNGDEEDTQSKKKQIGFYEPNMTALEELVERLDTMDIGSEGGIGTEAMIEFWNCRPDYFEIMSFDDEFFHELTVEKAFIARTFYEYCSQNPAKHLEAVEAQKFPEVTRFGYYLQHHLRQVTEMYTSLAAEMEVDEDKLTEQEFVCEQLLHIAHFLDYTDEIGRRKMFSLLRDTIAMSTLSDEITKLAIEALRLTCTQDLTGEKEFIAVVQEAMVEVQDEVSDEAEEDNGTNRETSPADDDSFVSAHSEISQRSDETARPSHTTKKNNKNLTPQETEELRERTLLVQLKCLNIAHSLLQNITSDFSTNISLETMLNTLIIPAVRAREEKLRERAIDCLGLACLLSQSLWANNHDLFMACMRRGHEELRERALKILCDCTIVHHGNSSQTADDQPHQETQVDLSAFTQAFEFSTSVQTCAATCIAKLMMAGFYKPSIKAAGSDAGEDGERSDITEIDPFEAAIEEATQAGVKGCDLLAKVKAAMVADATAMQKAQAEAEKRLHV